MIWFHIQFIILLVIYYNITHTHFVQLYWRVRRIKNIKKTFNPLFRHFLCCSWYDIPLPSDIFDIEPVPRRALANSDTPNLLLLPLLVVVVVVVLLFDSPLVVVRSMPNYPYLSSSSSEDASSSSLS